MSIEVTSKVDNNLLERKEVEFVMSYKGKTPTREEMKNELGQKIAANPDLIVLRFVEGYFGTTKIRGSAHVYYKKEIMLKNEPEYLLKRAGAISPEKEEKKDGGEPATQKAEEKAAPKKAEKPKGAKKEEKK